MKKFIILLISSFFMISCNSVDIRNQLEAELKEDLQIQVDAITDKTVLLDEPKYDIRMYEMVSGTLISKLAIVDFYYFKKEKFDIFQRRVYRYNESIKGWQIHKKYMLKNSLINDDLKKYMKLN